jgi:hypothetical protein
MVLVITNNDLVPGEVSPNDLVIWTLVLDAPLSGGRRSTCKLAASHEPRILTWLRISQLAYTRKPLVRKYLQNHG